MEVNVDIYNSLSGEISMLPQGRMITFLRFQDCNLQLNGEGCVYCDTHNVFQPRPLQAAIDDLHDCLKETHALCITGGEPMIHEHALMTILGEFDKNFKQSRIIMETNGTIDCRRLIGKIGIVTDYKLHVMDHPASWMNRLTNNDFIKFIISNKAGLKLAIAIQHDIQKRNHAVNFAYSVMFSEGIQDVKYTQQQMEMIVIGLQEANLQASVNIQMHKFFNFK